MAGGLNRSYYQRGEERNRIVSKLHSLLSRYMLRRTKGEVRLSLPPKVEALVYTPLSHEQVRMLRALEAGTLAEEVRALGWVPTEKIDDPSHYFDVGEGAASDGARGAGGDSGSFSARAGAGAASTRSQLPSLATASSSSSSSAASASASGGGASTPHALIGLGLTSATGLGGVGISTLNRQMQMRKICNHPFWIAEPPLPPGTFTDERIITCSGKMVVLDKMLRRLKADGHKVLIFSQFTTVLAMLEDYFKYVGASVLGDYRVVHGGIPEEERDEAIKQFNAAPPPDNDIFAFLLSTKAGGQGINLVAADTVIFFDSDWNPTGDQQAMDRAHRIGQTRPVVVYRLVTEGASVERRMVRKAASKGSLARMVLQEGRYRFGSSGAAASKAGSKQRGGAGAGAAAGASKGGRRSVDGLTSESEPEGAADEADASGSEPAAGPAAAAAALKSGVSSYGLISPALLRYWLRDDVSDRHLTAGGIPEAELSVILDRYRALQAGKRVADEVEAELLKEGGHASSSSSEGAGAGVGVRRGVGAGAGFSSSSSSSSSAASPASASTGTGADHASASAEPSPASGRKRTHKEVATQAHGKGAAAGAGSSAGASSSASATAGASSVSRTASGGLHVSPPPSAPASAAVIQAAEAEQVNWEALAAAAAYTSSRGSGYEFVYHSTARGILPAASTHGSAGTAAMATAADTCIEADSGASHAASDGPSAAHAGAGHRYSTAAGGSAAAAALSASPAASEAARKRPRHLSPGAKGSDSVVGEATADTAGADGAVHGAALVEEIHAAPSSATRGRKAPAAAAPPVPSAEPAVQRASRSRSRGQGAGR
jgi:hypothetical protein